MGKRLLATSLAIYEVFYLLIEEIDLVICWIYGWHTWIFKYVTEKWSNIQERCGMSWNKWKINFPISILWVMVDFVLEIGKFFDEFWVQKLSSLRIFSANLTTFERLLFLVADTLENVGVSPVNCKYNQP